MEVGIGFIQDAGERPKNVYYNSVLRKQIQELLVQEELHDPKGTITSCKFNSNDWIQQDTPIAEEVLSDIVKESTSSALDALIAMRAVKKYIQQIYVMVITLENIISHIDTNKSGAVEAYRTY